MMMSVVSSPRFSGCVLDTREGKVTLYADPVTVQGHRLGKGQKMFIYQNGETEYYGNPSRSLLETEDKLKEAVQTKHPQLKKALLDLARVMFYDAVQQSFGDSVNNFTWF